MSALLHLTITGPEGDKVLSASQRVRTTNGTVSTFIPFEITSPQLWHGTIDPALYTFHVTLSHGGSQCDELGATATPTPSVACCSTATAH